MLTLRSSDLDLAASSLLDSASSVRRDSAVRAASWQSFLGQGNRADFLDSGFAQSQRILEVREEIVGEMALVSAILFRTADTLRSIEFDTHRVIAMADAATQESESYAALLADIQAVGRAIDRACAAEITAVCTQQAPTTHSLSDFDSHNLQEIHEYVLATVSDDVRAVAEQFPEARLLPANDGVVLAFGDIETSPSVVTVIPGVGSADPRSWAGYAARTQAIAASTDGAGVLWLDYRAPANVVAATATHPAAMGGDRLQDFQAELRRRAARKGNEPLLHVVAHSYGSVVAGHAAKGAGLQADSLIVMGSPGVGVAHASELDLRGDSPIVIAMTSPSDPIGLTTGATGGVHGSDPADPMFGADRIWPAAGGHSDYWDSADFHQRLQELARRN